MAIAILAILVSPPLPVIFEIDILLLHSIKKIILVLQVPTLTSIISAISKSIFKILVAIM